MSSIIFIFIVTCIAMVVIVMFGDYNQAKYTFEIGFISVVVLVVACINMVTGGDYLEPHIKDFKRIATFAKTFPPGSEITITINDPSNTELFRGKMTVTNTGRIAMDEKIYHPASKKYWMGPGVEKDE